MANRRSPLQFHFRKCNYGFRDYVDGKVFFPDTLFMNRSNMLIFFSNIQVKYTMLHYSTSRTIYFQCCDAINYRLYAML